MIATEGSLSQINAAMRAAHRAAFVWVLVTMLALPVSAVGLDLDQQIQFNIPAQDLSAALIQFSKQSRLQVVIAKDLTGATTQGVNGQKPIRQALYQLLEPAGLRFRVAGETSIAVAPPAEPPPAHEESSDNALLQEVIVTATKRSEAAQRVGIAITAFSAEQMKQLGIVGSTDLALHTPGLQLQTSGGEGNTMSMTLRGVGQNDFNDHQESPVAIYVDEVYSSALTATSFQAFDLDRVEVLRGPQGTLFGRNATGGLVHFVTAKPTKSLEGYMNLAYGRFNEVAAEAAVSGPLSDGVQARASFATHQRDQYFKNTLLTGSGGNGKNDVSGRLQLAMQPTETVDIRLVARASESKNAGPRGKPGPELYNDDGLPAPLPEDVDFWGTGPGNNPAGYRVRGSNDWKGAFDQYNPLRLSQWGTAAHITASLGDVTLFSISDYSHFTHDYREDTDLGPTRGEEYAARSGIDQFSQELRAEYDASSVQAIAGLYFLDIDGDYRNEFLSRTPFVGITSPPVNLGPEGSGSLMNWSLRTKSYSAFTQFNWQFAPTLKAVLGARWTRDEKHDQLISDQIPLQLGQDVLSPEDPGLVTLLTYDNKRKDSFTSWKAGLDWTPLSNLLAYASVTRGQKAGGYSVPFFVSTPDTLSFVPEELTSYEAGLKWSGNAWLRRINLAAFHYDYKNYQAYEFVNSIGSIYNVDAVIDGAEAEVTLTPMTPLTVQVGGAFIFDATVKDIGLPSGRVTDTDVPQTPKLSLTGLIRYDWTINGRTFSAQADGRYQTSQYFDAFNSPENKEPGYGLANLRAFFSPNKQLTTSVYVENLANKSYRTFALDAGGFAQQWLGVPRTYGISANYRF